MLAAIIQARMTSTRLPGKVLLEVMGRPLLSYMIERLRATHLLENIIIATTDNSEDDPIALFAKKEKIPFYRGSENDVLDRYYRAAKKFNINHIMRLTSDCPLIDPFLCDQFLQVYFESDADLVHTGPSYCEGLDCEVFPFSALETAWQAATMDSEREHVTLYLHNHPELFNRLTLINETDDSNYRFTIDQKEDFLVVKAIFEALYRDGSEPFATHEIKKFLNDHPEIARINHHIVRNEGLAKSLQEDEGLV